MRPSNPHFSANETIDYVEQLRIDKKIIFLDFLCFLYTCICAKRNSECITALPQNLRAVPPEIAGKFCFSLAP